MTNEEIIQKINNVKDGTADSEIFDLLRPPEEFGDAVELSYNDKDETFKAVVFDPQTKTVYSEEFIKDKTEVRSFIHKTVK
ncbi:hypothetical protein [Bacillus solitudinis]|uniref:hypothetical protein n=1 Tax=Bacillus solitudinis TaxID=2014074 RepID=UPI000C23B634|nr:hypothetical protein [Bacillus solitudinis]